MAGESQQIPNSSPDPSVITTENIDKAIDNESKLTDAKLAGLEAKALSNHNICIEKFKSIKDTLALVERQRVEQKLDTEKAVGAALAAAKEAVKEQTTASDKAIDKSAEINQGQQKQMSDNFATKIGGLENTLSDMKDRLVAIEARKQGATETADIQRQLAAAGRQNVSVMIAAAAVIIAALGVAVSIILIGN